MAAGNVSITLSARTESFRSDMKSAVRSLGDIRQSVASLSGSVSGVQQLGRSFADVSKAISSGGIGDQIGSITSAVAGLMMVGPTMATTFKSLPFLLSGVAPVALALGAAIAVVVLATGLMSKAWRSDLGGMRTSMGSFATDVSAVWSKLTGWMVDMWDAVVLAISKVSKVFAGLIQMAQNPMQNPFEVWDAMSAGEDAPGATRSQGQAAADFTKGAWSEGVDKIKDTFGGILSGATKETVAADFSVSAPGVGATTVRSDVSGVGGLGKGFGFAETMSISDGADQATTYYDTIYNAAGQTVADGLQVIGDATGQVVEGLVPKMGEFGDVIQAGAQGMQAGPMGAVVAVVVELLSKTQGFRRIVEVLNRVLASVVSSIEPLMSVAAVLVEAAEPIIGVLLQLASLFSGLLPAAELLKPVVRAVSRIIGSIAGGLKDAYNWMIEKFADIADMIGLGDDVRDWKIKDKEKDTHAFDAISQRAKDLGISWIDAMRTLNVNIGAVKLNTAKLAEGGKDAAGANRDATGSVYDLSDSFLGLGRTVDKVSESLTNMPSGFRVAIARYEASAAVMPHGAAGGGITVGTMIVQASTPALAAEIRRGMEQQNLVDTGSSSISTSPFTASQRQQGW